MCINVNTHTCTYMEINKNLNTLKSSSEPLWDSAYVSLEAAQKQQGKECGISAVPCNVSLQTGKSK